MDLKNLFTCAHAMARENVKLVGDYKIAFSLALKSLYQMLHKQTREAEFDEYEVIVVTDDGTVLGYDYADDYLTSDAYNEW